MSEKRKEPFGDLMKSMNQFFHEKPVKNFMQTMDDFFKNPFPFATSFHVEVNENAEDYIIKAELPGINREQIELNAINNYIKITIHRLDIETREDDLQQIYQKKQAFQQSTRTIPLPFIIDESTIQASHTNGLLIVKVPKPKGKRINLQ